MKRYIRSLVGSGVWHHYSHMFNSGKDRTDLKSTSKK